VYYNLFSSLKRRIILELQDSFSRHPVYAKVVPFIQNRFTFAEQPQYGIVVKGSSSNKVQLSGDMLEWVREDTAVLVSNGDAMPTPPGVYYFECLSVPTNVEECGTFAIDPLLTATNEVLLRPSSSLEREVRLRHVPAPNAVRLWDNHNNLLVSGRDYTIDAAGNVRFAASFYPSGIVTADYRYPAPSLGPIEFYWNRADAETLPGVVLAFGKRAKVGDKIAVVVTADRVDVSRAFGGKFEASFDLDVIAQDPTQLEEIADFAVMALWGEKKSALEYEGIEILDVTMGGESEEPVDEAGDTYQYMASLSVQLRADWEMHTPLPLTISRVKVTSSGGDPTLHLTKGGLYYATAPVLPGRNHAFERIT
jgi:hypothetical protein